MNKIEKEYKKFQDDITALKREIKGMKLYTETEKAITKDIIEACRSGIRRIYKKYGSLRWDNLRIIHIFMP